MSNDFVKHPNVQVLMLKGERGSNDYNDLINKPTKLSDFANDGVFVTNTTDDLVNYYTKEYIDQLTPGGGGATTALYTATLLAGDWEETTGTTVPYTQTVDITGILATDTPIVDVVLDSTASTALDQLEAWGCVEKITTAGGSITAFCMETMPTTDIPIQLKVVR